MSSFQVHPGCMSTSTSARSDKLSTLIADKVCVLPSARIGSLDP